MNYKLVGLGVAVLVALGAGFLWWNTSNLQTAADEGVVEDSDLFGSQDEAVENIGASVRKEPTPIKRVTVGKDLSIELPIGWSYSKENPITGPVLLSSSGKVMAEIRCPIPAVGGPYGATDVHPVLKRKFMRGGVEYETSFLQLDENSVEEPVNDEIEVEYVFSLVHPVDESQGGDSCMLTRYDSADSNTDDLTEGEISALKSVYLSWE